MYDFCANNFLTETLNKERFIWLWFKEVFLFSKPGATNSEVIFQENNKRKIYKEVAVGKRNQERAKERICCKKENIRRNF